MTELKAEIISDDSVLNGKKALFAKIASLDELVRMVRAEQKVYTSMEIRPNLSNSGKCYLIGLAVTDDPASLGTEYLEFCSRAAQNPLAGKKDQSGDLFSVASLAALEFEDVPDTLLNSLTDKVKAIFSRKQASFMHVSPMCMKLSPPSPSWCKPTSPLPTSASPSWKPNWRSLSRT